jgi:anti-sigma-K factor RskA
VQLKRFHRLVDINGPEIGRWPAGRQRAARRLLARDPAARAVLDSAHRLGDLLTRVPAPPAVDAARITAALTRLPAQQTPSYWTAPIALWDLLPRWPRAAALAAMAAFGILVGLTDLDGTPAPASSADVSGLIFDPTPAIGLGH